ncbi:MAG: type II 3-dehydroquinate dehydratase [Candidatus Latescibacteria bacterium]|nr:type II 3-dehydroquinate dehydratase [Candidatus Latescibacterota bacterium]
MKILILQGPNINMLGRRKTEYYGTMTMDEIHERLEGKAGELGCEIECFHSNYEGALVEKVQEVRDSVDGIIMNPAGLTTTSVSLRDAIDDSGLPLVEIHLSNIHAREEWRRHSMFSEIAVAIVAGFRWRGYVSALDMLVGMLCDEK